LRSGAILDRGAQEISQYRGWADEACAKVERLGERLEHQRHRLTGGRGGVGT
jgi:hypothetical protein